MAAKPPASRLANRLMPVPVIDDDNVLPELDEENHRFVIPLSDGDCEIIYKIEDRTITFSSINIPELAQGQGMGKKLALFAFNYAIKNKLDVLIKCSFLAEYYMDKRVSKKYGAKYSKLRVTGRYPQETIDPEF